jgi:hypothetical protein
VIVTEPRISVEQFTQLSGWEPKPEGLCRGEVCVPAPGVLDGRLVDVAAAAERLRMPIVHDDAHGVTAVGPSSGARALATAIAPDPVLADFDGNPFLLSAMHGRKVLLVAWASW